MSGRRCKSKETTAQIPRGRLSVRVEPASRSEYWWWTLFTTVTAIALSVPALVIGMRTSPDGGETPGLPAVPLLVLLVLFYLAVLVPTIAVTVRRLHDAGYSGWLALLALIPWLGGLILLVFTLLPPSLAGSSATTG